MSFSPPAADKIFAEALLRATGPEQAAFLNEACGNHVDLRLRVERLLRAHGDAESFLETPPSSIVRHTHAAIDQPMERPGTLIGPYKLLQQIGEGGFGVVFMAEQFEPVRRKVAVKVIKPGMDTRQVIARFEAERQALAVMDHPNIARVLDAGATESGRPYFVMELVRGTPITQYCDENNLPIRERLELFASVCQAIQHAHTKGIIHRDIKPTNVLITQQDGQANVKVIDFGIAKAMGQQLTEKTLFTEFAQLIGTPLYMSPEQAAISSEDIDTRSDIYSLGVLLYELLTGSTPVSKDQLKQAALDEIRRIIREDEPPKPSTRISGSDTRMAIAARRHAEPARLSRLVRGELDWIVMKCLEKDRNRRYETAASLAADVKRFLNDEQVQACPPSTFYRLQKLARRHQRALVSAAAVALAAILAVAALAVSTFLVWGANSDLTDSLDRERLEANFHRITLAHRDLSADNLGRALKLLADCPDDLREWEWHYLMRLCKVEPLVLHYTTDINAVAFSPDGQWLASAGGDGFVQLWNSRTGEFVRPPFRAHNDSVVCVAFHPGGEHLATAGADKLVKVWSLKSGQEVFHGPCDAIRKFGSAYTVAFRPPDGRQLAAGSDGAVRIWDWKERRHMQTFPGHEFHSISVAFSPDGHCLATGGAFREGQKLWDADRGGLPLCTFPPHPHPVSALAFSHDGKRLASASFDRTVNVCNAATGELLYTLEHPGNVDCVTFSRDGRRIATGGEDKTVRIWDATTGREVLGLRGHSGRCGCVAFSPDGRRLASASTDGTIRIWDAAPLRGYESQELLTFTQHSDDIYSVAINPHDGKIASAGYDPLVKVWNAETGELSAEFPGHTVVVFCLAWQPDGLRVASAGSEGRLHSVKVWDAQTGREAFAILAGRENFAVPYLAVAFSPDGRYLITGKANGAMQVWEATTGREVGTLGTHDREIRGVIVSPDGKHLASASSEGIVKLWDATRLDQAQEARLTLRTRVPGACLNVAFSPNGRRLATGGEENTVKIWDVQTGRELQTLRGHNGDVYTLAFSPDSDGRWIVSAGADSAVKVWDSHAGTLVRNFRGHTGLVSSVAFTSDGRRLVSGSRDKTVKVWDMTPWSDALSKSHVQNDNVPRDDPKTSD
jgi:WD40 repeat protein/serine/threonine protein kinase